MVYLQADAQNRLATAQEAQRALNTARPYLVTAQAPPPTLRTAQDVNVRCVNASRMITFVFYRRPTN